MPKLSLDEIRKRFESSKEFDEIFDAFQQALEHRADSIELYRQLFWNSSLAPDELCMFGEKLSREFPHIAYDSYMWLASVFGVTYSMFDNYELALTYFQKAASARPAALDPYLDAADCYEPDLNIPPLSQLIGFLKVGVRHVPAPHPLYHKLAHLYEIGGNDEMSKYFRQRANEQPPPSPPTEQIPPAR